jgi:hypothetical protein
MGSLSERKQPVSRSPLFFRKHSSLSRKKNNPAIEEILSEFDLFRPESCRHFGIQRGVRSLGHDTFAFRMRTSWSSIRAGFSHNRKPVLNRGSRATRIEWFLDYGKTHSESDWKAATRGRTGGL